MAFKNSLKVTLLTELEQPRLRSDEADPIFDAPAQTVAQPPGENTATPAPAVAKPATKPRRSGDAFIAATWHARADELCAMADTLPSKDSWSLISKIASLYDELARDAGWSEEEAAPLSDDVRLEEPPAEDEELPAEDEPPAPAAPSEPPAPERIAFPRRSLPLARAVPRRRA